MRLFRPLLRQLPPLPVQILFVIVLAIFLTPFFSTFTLEIFYTISCLFKEGLMLILPILIFCFIFSSMLKFARQAPVFIAKVLSTVIFSNVLALAVALMVTMFFMQFFSVSLTMTNQDITQITPLLSLSIPYFWSPKNAMILGGGLGIFLSFFMPIFLPNTHVVGKIEQVIETLKEGLIVLLNRFFIPFLPLFVFGFFMKLHFEGVIESLIYGLGKTIILTLLIFAGYLWTLSLAVNHFDVQKSWQQLKASFGTFLIAFSTMSSIIVMPLVLKDAKRYVEHKDYPSFLIPFIVNIHMVGSSIIFGIMIIVIVHFFGKPMPSFFSAFRFF